MLAPELSCPGIQNTGVTKKAICSAEWRWPPCSVARPLWMLGQLGG